MCSVPPGCHSNTVTVISTQTVDGFICRFVGLLKFNKIIDLLFINTELFTMKVQAALFFCLIFFPKIKVKLDIKSL